MKTFVITFNRYTWTRKLCEDLADVGLEVIMIDNGSTYLPLIEWQEDCPFTVYRMKRNYGHKVFWEANLDKSYTDENYIITDHDLDISQVPKDFVDVLTQGLALHDVVKCGLSLEIDDLPDNEYTQKVKEWEGKFWETPRIKGYYASDIDTTLAVYSRDKLSKINNFFSALRAPKPYTARHLPWYNELDKISEEEKFYINSSVSCGYWNNKFKEIYGINRV